MSATTPHDNLFKAIFSRPTSARALIEFALPAAIRRWIDFESLVLENANVIGSRLEARYADLVFSARARGATVLLHLLIEHKSSSTPLTIIDLFTSAATLLHAWRRRHRTARRVPIVLPLLVHHGNAPFSGSTRIRDAFQGDEAMKQALDPWLPTFPIVLLDLSTQQPAELDEVRAVDQVAGCALWMLRWSRTPRFEQRLIEVDWLRALLDDPKMYELSRLLLSYALIHVKPSRSRREFAEEFVKRFSRRTGKVIENFLEGWIEDGRVEGRAEGRAEGRTEGRTEGRAEATLNTLRRSIVRVLMRRFGEASDSVRPEIELVKDATKLERLLDKAVDASSLADFQATLAPLGREPRNRRS